MARTGAKGGRKRGARRVAERPLVAEPAPVGAAELEAPRSDADESYLQRRDVLLEAVQTATARGLRRVMADEQNAALDRLRTQRADTVALDGLLGEETTQLAAWSERAFSGLADGAAAGARLATGHEPGPVPHASVATLADDLAAALVRPLRQRIAAVIESTAGDRGPATADGINSVYREWRSRIEPAVGDALTAAVSAGMGAELAKGTLVRWVVEDVDGPCSDCDDNALAGPTPLGDPFPTGQDAPPAHPGCRCVLMQSTT